MAPYNSNHKNGLKWLRKHIEPLQMNLQLSICPSLLLKAVTDSVQNDLYNVVLSKLPLEWFTRL